MKHAAKHETSPPRARDPDVLTVIAIGAVVYVSAKLLHEAVGHGVVCALVGARWEGFSTAWNMCDYGAVGDWPRRAVKAAGTVVNLVVGLAALLVAQRVRGIGGATRYFLWLLAAVNSLMAAGYLAVDSLFGFGDWTAFLERLPGAGLVRWILAAGGAGLYAVLVILLLRRLRPFIRRDGKRSKALAWKLTLYPYIVCGGLLLTGAALLNALGPVYALTSGLATLGGTSALAWMAACVDEKPSDDDRDAVDTVDTASVERSWFWIVSGVIAAVLCVALVGPGIVFAK